MRENNPVDLMKDYEISFRWNILPRNSTEQQKKIIGIYYDNINGIPLEELSEDSIFRIAERLYSGAHDTISGLQPYQKEILGKLYDLMAARKRNPGSRAEGLEERIYIMLEGNNEPAESLLTQCAIEILDYGNRQLSFGL